MLESGAQLVAHNAAFDWALLALEFPELQPVIVAAYDTDRITCTEVREQLLENARGQLKWIEDDDTGEVKRSAYSLAAVAAKRLGITLDKGADTWRLRYGELATVPTSSWPREAVSYAIDDAVIDLAVYEHQETDPDHAALVDQWAQARAAFALSTMGARGLLVDALAVDALAGALERDRDALRLALAATGIIRDDGSTSTKRVMELVTAAYAAKGAKVTTTKTGVAINASVLRDSGNPDLVRFADLKKLSTLLSSFIGKLRSGFNHPISARYNALVSSGRTSCAGEHGGPNVQQLPR